MYSSSFCLVNNLKFSAVIESKILESNQLHEIDERMNGEYGSFLP